MRRAGILVSLGVLALHVAITVAWYATPPHTPPASTLVPWIGLFVCGLVLGLLVAQGTIGYAVALAVAMPLATSLVHMAFARVGSVQDARGGGAALLLGAILLPISLALCCAGALLGAWLRRRGLRSD
jgi:hypothetical protein